MAFFKRGDKQARKKKKGRGKDPQSGDDATPAPPSEPADPSAPESSPQRVGVVSGVLSTTAETGASDGPLFGDVVSRRFGPGEDAAAGSPAAGSSVTEEDATRAEESVMPDDATRTEGSVNEGDAASSDQKPARKDHLRAVEPLFPEHPAPPELEVDPMAHIGRATTITGNLAAEEDLEIHGTIDGSVRVASHQVTVGAEGHVKASVEAQVVSVYGRITGDVVAGDLVEIEKGGIVGGDIKAPRVIMHDGAIVVGTLDMSASLPKCGAVIESQRATPEPEDHDGPRLAWVVSPPDAEDPEPAVD